MNDWMVLRANPDGTLSTLTRASEEAAWRFAQAKRGARSAILRDDGRQLVPVATITSDGGTWHWREGDPPDDWR